MSKLIKFMNLLNPEANLKPKKETRSKITIYFQNSVIKENSEMLKIISQGSCVKVKYYLLNYVIV